MREFIASLDLPEDDRQREPGAGGGGDTIFALDDAFAKDRDRAADIAGIGEIRDKTHVFGLLAHVDLDLAHRQLVLDRARLHDGEAFAGVYGHELFAVADDGEAADLTQIRDRGSSD